MSSKSWGECEALSYAFIIPAMERGLKYSIMLAAVIAACAPVRASVPPSGWNAPTYVGPGLLCSSAFTLRLEVGEKAVQGFPSVGRVPYTVEADRMRFGVIEDWFSGDEHRPYERPRRIAGGKVYPLLGSVTDLPSRAFLFVPDDKKRPRFSVAFYSGVSGHFDDFPVARERSILDRITFAAAEPSTCLQSSNPA